MTILTLLETQVARQPDTNVLTLLHNGETPADTLTYRQLAQRARAIAAHLLHAGAVPGERVLLVYAEGLEFLPAFLGCLYAGVVAVPTPAPDALRGKRTLPHLQAVYADAAASRVLTTQHLKDLLPATPPLPILTTDDLPDDTQPGEELPNAAFPTLHPHQLAYLQYTSGSTASPKGVMISHANVLANLEGMHQVWPYTPDAVAITWMPHTHDFGLVGGLLRPVLCGVPSYIMPPGAFLRKPLRWLKAISQLRVTHCGGASFAFQQCLQHFNPQDYAGLDLSCWKMGVLGAEPIRADVLDAFATTFAPYGFSADTYCPAYGLAEGTLMVTARGPASELKTHRLDLPREGHTTLLTGCGQPWADTDIQIVDPQTCTLLPEGQIGEIWVAGATVALGYWQRAQETAEAFGNMLNGRTYLRTGDLGLVEDGTLYVTGRLKDLIILHGQNYYPQDIEWSAEAAHPLLQNGSKAAFALDDLLATPGAERVGIICEIDPKAAKTIDPGAVVQAIRERVGIDLLLTVHAVVLVKRGVLPRTPSGKVQRRASRLAWLNGEMEILHTWQLDRDVPLPAEALLSTGASDGATLPQTPQTSLEEMLARIWCEVLGVSSVSMTDNFFAVGGNSLLLVSAYSALCAQLGRAFPLADLFTYPDIRSLARHLSGQEEGMGMAQVQERIRKQRRGTAGGDGASDIAVIGLAGRFPGAGNVEEFWENLKNGVESIRQFTDEELLAEGLDATLLADPHYVKAGTVIEGVESFDAGFFGMSPREAAITDPQHRLFMECAWEACESAGYDPQTYPEAIGVFGGAGVATYLFANLFSNRECWKIQGDYPIMLGNDEDYVATRTSYRLGLRGPSMTVQTACSTSLVATHLACRSLLNNECEMALAGGASVKVPHRAGYLYQESGIFSPDGHCRTFDAEARGTVFGSGAGVVLLKRLEDALHEGDHILAVIKGTAINNDGATKVGFTAPGVQGQAEAIAAAAGTAGVPFDAISYVETHGTATALGDPIEIEALTRAFRTQTTANGFCALGSVKSNIGHLDVAAGAAGLIKTVLALHHRQLPPSLHFNTPNPHIDFVNSPFYVNTALVDWNTTHAVRLAGVSAFGMGGTNSHAILAEAPPQQPSGPARPWLLLPLSARTPKALEEATANLSVHLNAHPNLSLPDAAYTLQTGRHRFGARRLLLCRNTPEALQSLQTPTAEKVWTKEEAPSERRVVFLFPGQGIDLVNQGRQLYETEAVFRDQIDRCARVLVEELGEDLRAVLYPSPEREEWAREQMRRTALAQPAIFVVEYALAQLWRAWGIEPAAMIGHSLGEYVAACVSGVFSLEEGLRLVAARGRIMQEIAPGAMLAVALPEEEARALLDLSADLSLAAVNAPRQCILSGELAAIEQVEAVLGARGVTCARLSTSHAFHSGMMEGAIAPFTAAVCAVTLGAPQIPYLSNVTGSWAQGAEVMSAEYWGRHLREAVRYGAGIAKLQADLGEVVFLEVGPGTVLSRLTGMVLGKANCTTIASLPGKSRSAKGAEEAVANATSDPKASADWEELGMMEAVGRLWLEGASVDWRSFSAGQRRLRVPLPTYPFQRKRHWIEPDARSATMSEAVIQGRTFPLTGRGIRPDEEDAARFATAIALGADTRQPDIADWFYAPAWTHSPLLPPYLTTTQSSPCLVFADDTPLSARLIQRLKQQKENVIAVYQGTHFQQQEPGRFTLDPTHPDDYQRLMQEVGVQHLSALRILHLWNLNDLRDPTLADPLRTCRELGFSSLLAVTRALHSGSPSQSRVAILMVTQYLADVRGDEPLQPQKAILLGPCLVIPQENPGISCGCIDVTLPADEAQADWLVDQLLAESVRETRELLVAYRSKRRWSQDYRPVKIPLQPMRHPSLHQERVYLITGGLGEIGLALAEHLGRTAHARLVLVGRTAFPARAQWEEWLQTHAETEPMHAQLQRLIALEGVATSVTVLSADIAEPGQLQQVIDTIYTRFEGLHGVFHTEEIAEEVQEVKREVVDEVNALSPGSELEAATVEMHFRPKILGLQALDQALWDRPVDFCVFFGFDSAMPKRIDSATYTAVNCFMNAFAEDRSRESDLRWICVNWDPRLAAKNPAFGLTRKSPDNTELTETARMAVLDHILSGYVAGPLVVSVNDPGGRTSKLGKPYEVKRLETVKDQSRAATDAAKPTAKAAEIGAMPERENIKAPYVAPATDTERTIVDIWQYHLGIAPIGIRDDFFELGGDSLLATQMLGRIREETQTQIDIFMLLENPTIEGIAQAITQAQAAEYDPDLISALLDQVTVSGEDPSEMK